MKKVFAGTLLCTFASIANAQSNITVYGLIDTGFGSRNGGNYEGGPATFAATDNGNSSSMFGFKGTEDLGGGMQANFKLEEGFHPNTGANKAGTAFNREAWVGLSGNFGQFRAGLQDSTVDLVLGQYDLNWGPNITSSYGNLGLQAIYDVSYGTQRPSQIQYWTPKFGGFSAQLGFIPRSAITLSKPQNVYQVGANYVIGHFSVGAAYESAHADSSSLRANWGTSAKYDFGPFVVSTNYYSNAVKANGQGYGAGVMVPIGTTFDVGTQVAHNTGVNGTAWELFSHYYLSKRTSFYAYYGGMNNNAQIFDKATKGSSYVAGIIHKF
jgi:predicted porin